MHLSSSLLLLLFTLGAATTASADPQFGNQDTEQRVDMTVPQLKATDLPSCPANIVALINTCLEYRSSDQKVACSRFQTGPAALPLLQQCNCQYSHQTYVCLNRPGCMAPLALTIPGATAASHPPTGADGMVNGLLGVVRQQKLVTGMQISQHCIAARASGVDNVEVTPSEKWVDQDAGTDRNAKPFQATTLPAGVQSLGSGAAGGNDEGKKSAVAMVAAAVAGVAAAAAGL
ncbi:hypothetical protein BCR44DRAFT_40130 [Catenaria anguillulae PL171]|uniref:Extracellular membrane protein CFEM domain-containing protein n=1 Tax=Catenaria anguillulae PL171 TaxID=765915 RepID=A0A1Y2HLR6_9FUNG|nr:hypothetical protein BCR44DRAFT_40130 [Catenaria anguillulae PL171]